MYNLFLLASFLLLSPLILVLILFDIQKIRQRLFITPPRVIDSRNSILIHGASLGEMHIIKKIIPELKKKYPSYILIVSSVTETGKKFIDKTETKNISHSIFLPIDIKWSVKKMVKICKPKILVIVETELWPNLIVESKRYGAKVVLINGRISDNSFGKYLLLKNLFHKLFKNFSNIGVQSKEYLERFEQLGCDKTKLFIINNIKQSLVTYNLNDSDKSKLKHLLKIKDSDNVFIAASTRPGEEEIILKAFLKIKKTVENLSLIIAPRHPKRCAEIERLLKNIKISYNKMSSLESYSNENSVLLVDTLGDLIKMFSIADVTFVGGTLKPFGGHNLLEPLSYMSTVCFGPFYESQKESGKLLLNSGCGKVVNSEEEIKDFILEILQNKNIKLFYKKNIEMFLKQSQSIIKSNINLI